MGLLHWENGLCKIVGGILLALVAVVGNFSGILTILLFASCAFVVVD